MGLWGEYDSETITNGQEQQYKTTKVFAYNDDNALYKAIDIGWSLSLGAMFPSGLYARIDYGIPFSNIAKAASSKAKNRDGFGISVGYNINKDRNRGY